MLHYAAAGVPILSTPFGARGLELQNDHHLWLADVPHLAPQARQLLALAPDEREARTRRARDQAERLYDWRVIADALPLDEGPVGSIREPAMVVPQG
jgi:glycosyltransferase involved in cell wall biosynthesis